MAAIEAALSATGVSGVLMCGAAGVGKSRIAREALAAATTGGHDCRWVVGTSSAQSVPLGAFSAWAGSGTTDTIRLLREVIEALTATSSGAPVVIGVDDVHLLDELSTFVVHQVVQRGAAKVILTVRDEPNSAALLEILKLGQFERLDLQPLSAEETSALLATVLGGPVAPHAARGLWTLTQGNALYLQNIVEHEITEDRLVRQHGVWQWTGDPVVPPGLVELIESRIGNLPTSVGDVVDALAVGEPIGLAALQRITAATAVEEADTRGLITLEPVAGGMEVRVAHPLYGEVRRRRAPATRLRRLRGLVATELASAADRDDLRMVVRRATLSLDSDLPPDPDLLVRAAHGAIWLADLPLADRLAEAAAHAGAGPEPNFVRAHALSWLGRGEQAEEVLAGIDPQPLTDTERARLAFLRASNMLWALGSTTEAKHLIAEASRGLSPQARIIYTDAFLAVYAFATDDPHGAAEYTETLDLERLPAIVGAEIAWVVSAVSADAGHTTAAVAAAETGYSVVDRSLDAPQMRFNIADAHISALLLSGEVQEAVELADHFRAQSADLPGTAQLLGAAVAGRAALGAGDLPTACSLLAQATSGLSSAGHLTGWAYRYQVAQTTALAMRGATDEATAHLAALDDRSRKFRSLNYERAIARAWVAGSQGAVSEAIALTVAAAEQARTKGQFAAEVLCLQTAAQFGERSVGARLRELASTVEGPRAGLAARFAESLRKADAAGLSDVSVDFEDIGDLVTAIDCAAHASLVFRVQGLRGSALKCSTRAADLAERCGVSTPTLRAAAETLPLTNREREIVSLIAEGLSNQAIAARLTLSVRTVESHVYRAMLKTETTSREDIASLLRHKKHS